MKTKFLLLFLSLFAFVGGVKAKPVEIKIVGGSNTQSGTTTWSAESGATYNGPITLQLSGRGKTGTFTISVPDGFVIDNYQATFDSKTTGAIFTIKLDGADQKTVTNAGGNEQISSSSNLNKQSSSFTINQAGTVIVGWSDGKIDLTNIVVNYHHVNHQFEDGFCAVCGQANPDAHFLYNVETEKFLSAGNEWGSAAVVDDYGIPVNVNLLSDGTYNINFLDDRSHYLKQGGWCWVDGNDNDRERFTVEKVDGGYHFLNADVQENNCLYAYTYEDGNKFRVAANATLNENYQNENQRVWRYLTLAERNQIVQSKKAAAEQAIAQSAGLQNLTTSLNGVSVVDVTNKVNNAGLNSSVEGWNWNKTGDLDGRDIQYGNNITEWFQCGGTLTQEISGLQKGIYKVSLNAMFRQGWKENCVTMADYGMSIAYLKAGENTVQIKDWASERVDDNNPDNLEQLAAAFESGKYNNVIYAYVGEDGKLPIEIGQKARLYGGWLAFNNLKLEYYQPAEANLRCKASVYGTFVAPFEVTLPVGLLAYEITDAKNGWAHLEGLDNVIPAYTPVLLSNETKELVEKSYTGYDTKGSETSTYLKGMYSADDKVPAGAYLLQDQGEGQKFYYVASETTGAANRCYMTLPAGVEVNAFSLTFDDVDAIEAVEALTSGEAQIFDLNGRKLTRLQKGVNIVNGKKIFVK